MHHRRKKLGLSVAVRWVRALYKHMKIKKKSLQLKKHRRKKNCFSGIVRLVKEKWRWFVYSLRLRLEIFFLLIIFFLENYVIFYSQFFLFVLQMIWFDTDRRWICDSCFDAIFLCCLSLPPPIVVCSWIWSFFLALYLHMHKFAVRLFFRVIISLSLAMNHVKYSKGNRASVSDVISIFVTQKMSHKSQHQVQFGTHKTIGRIDLTWFWQSFLTIATTKKSWYPI